ncbi:MAG: glycogen debranching enzyme N-terminal domain-containing protein [Deltaproteobacteria bacterium]|nr:glycogen debranching enzyme N-terminal domain-containing protein [Deltaproteobacteria bacterium]
MSDKLIQDPAPGACRLRFRGDVLVFSLSLPKDLKGNAWIRTNLGHAKVSRREIIDEVCCGEPRLQRDWFDIPMKRVSETLFRSHIPLCEVGHFEAKCYFLKEDETTPIWPTGQNIVINVEPSDTCCANIIYNAFVRQFGPNIAGRAGPTPVMADGINALNQAGYTVIPPSGTFRDFIEKLDFIISELGCRIIQLLPVHPTPTTYGRMGQFGSPYAALGFLSVDPALAQFDPKATPLEQFIELVDAVHGRNAKLIIDIAINHTGWAARLHEKHPSWLVRDQDGAIQVPGAWGVKWEDLTKLDYTQQDLWQYMAEVFLTWCRRGVDGFRCDAGYMIPVPAWQYIIASVRDQYPGAIFLNEGLGGKISVTRNLLSKGNFNWAYSELFQNYTRDQIENYLPEAMDISKTDGLTVHFAETHDNLRLAERSKVWARMRTALCALFSPNGAFGFANGVEWYATEKINVHEAPSLNWGADSNQVENIQRINAILKHHPAFHDRVDLKMIQCGVGNYVVMLRRHVPTGKWLLVAANLDENKETIACWDNTAVPHGGALTDLLGGEKVTLDRVEGHFGVLLLPGQVLCLTADPDDAALLRVSSDPTHAPPERIKQQQLRAKALDIRCYYHGLDDLESADPDEMASRLSRDPVVFCAEINPQSEESRVVQWQWPRDLKRQVMVPPGHFLWVVADTAFRASITDKQNAMPVLASEASLELDDGKHYILFTPQVTPEAHTPRTLELSVFECGRTEHAEAPLLFLCEPEKGLVKRRLGQSNGMSKSLFLLGTNQRGAMMRAPIRWGTLPSRYDALLAANMDSRYPESRLVLLTRCRGWVRFQGYSQDMDAHCVDAFAFDAHSRGCWGFRVPTGQGEHVVLRVCLEMAPGENRIRMVCYRDSAQGFDGRLSDSKPVEIILRPDIEWRSFHESTKAYQGAEALFPDAVTPTPDKAGFLFSPYGPQQFLSVHISKGIFQLEPEWQYMVHHFMDEERGFDSDSDLFSPGYFSVLLEGGKAFELVAGASREGEERPSGEDPVDDDVLNRLFHQEETVPLGQALDDALDHYVVKRGDLKTVISGYPWFLDWGRDSLIVVRGLVAAGKMTEARAVLRQFGRFEHEGTLPNMINGEDAGNRDTSDAALWFFAACGDLLRKEGTASFLAEKAGRRTLSEVLHSIGHFMIQGTQNGVRMDPESGLVFSPAHFTWMDTDFPAGTPRAGYPIEIQALWYNALKVLSRLDGEKGEYDWRALAACVQASIIDLFRLNEKYLSDCLHAVPGGAAKSATPDDFLRPNQLLAITLGAVQDPAICRHILAACNELLVPGAIRSLADRPVRVPISIVHNGRVLNDPHQPYWGNYMGDEDTRRKPAYHNGTAWTWLFPVYCEAWAQTYGDASRKTALSWLSSSIGLINSGCLGQVPEILDGDFPHTQRGCDAQAWGVSELLRVWKKLGGLT